MPLRVESFASYYTAVGGEDWRDEDYRANQFVHAVKGERFKGYADITYSGESIRIGDRISLRTNQVRAAEMFANWAVARLRRHRLIDRCQLVAVPCSGSCSADPLWGPPDELAKAIADSVAGATRAWCLEWRRPYQSSRKGGRRRTAAEHCRNLTEGEDAVRRDLPTILIDDVCTTGAHFQACAAWLRERGAVVRLALCAGRTQSTPPPLADPFSVDPETLDDFEP
jgi:hypothetical protein